MGRWLGIDHGTRRIGVAAGNTEDGIAGPLEMIPAQPAEAAIRRIEALAKDYGVEGVVVGWPLNMDDTEGPQAKLVRGEAVKLAEATGLDVRLWDERLTSFAADDSLEGFYTRKGRKARQDAIAAADMLRNFLITNGPDKAPRPADIPN